MMEVVIGVGLVYSVGLVPVYIPEPVPVYIPEPVPVGRRAVFLVYMGDLGYSAGDCIWISLSVGGMRFLKEGILIPGLFLTFRKTFSDH
jgi:hypothetical protein